MSKPLQNSNEETIWACVHYFDAKGRQYKLDGLAEELRNIGIKTLRSGFESDYDGYVEVEITLEQARALDEKYGSKLYIIGNGSTIEEQFADALRIEKMCKSN